MQKSCEKVFIKDLINRFANIYRFCNGNVNKFILLLRKGVYPYEHTDRWERFNETSSPNKKAFYSESNLEDITNKDYAHGQKMFKELKVKILGDYQDLYVQSDTLLLADVFENFRNKCIEISWLGSDNFFVCTWISLASLFKKDESKIRIINRYWYKTKVKLWLLTYIDMLLIVEKGIRGIKSCNT